MRVLGLMIHGDVLDLSDAEHGSGMRPSASIRPLKKASHALCERLSVPVLVESPLRLTSSRADVGEECYLVDPASSHMLVSKIKPCMCKYELIQTVKLRMAH